MTWNRFQTCINCVRRLAWESVQPVPMEGKRVLLKGPERAYSSQPIRSLLAHLSFPCLHVPCRRTLVYITSSDFWWCLISLLPFSCGCLWLSVCGFRCLFASVFTNLGRKLSSLLTKDKKNWESCQISHVLLLRRCNLVLILLIFVSDKNKRLRFVSSGGFGKWLLQGFTGGPLAC